MPIPPPATVTKTYQSAGHTFVFRYNDRDRDRRQAILWAGLMAADPAMPLTWDVFQTIADEMLAAMKLADYHCDSPPINPTIRN